MALLKDLEEIEKEESLKARREAKRNVPFKITRIDTKLSMIVPPEFKMSPQKK